MVEGDKCTTLTASLICAALFTATYVISTWVEKGKGMWHPHKSYYKVISKYVFDFSKWCIFICE